MQKIRMIAAPLLAGAAYAALVIWASRQLIRGLAGLVGWIGPLAGLEGDAVSYAVQVLAPLGRADIASPWLTALLISAAGGALGAGLFRHRRGRAASILVLCVLFIPLVLAALWCTGVNSIRVGALVSSLLPVLSYLL